MLNQRQFKRQLAALTYTAFEQKFTFLFGSPHSAQNILLHSINPRQTILDTCGNQLRGFIGYYCTTGGYFSFSPQTLRHLLPPEQLHQARRGLELLQSTFDRSTLYIEALAVAPNYRQQGIAGRLLETCKAYGRTHGYQKLALDVACTNTGARALYDKHGFTPAHRRSLASNALGFPYFDYLVYPLS